MRYKKRKSANVTNLATIPELHSSSFLNFVQNWDFKGNTFTKRGSRGALPYVANIWPRYRYNSEDEDSIEKYSYAKLLLHHPFEQEVELLHGEISYTLAFQNHCLALNHIHINTLPPIIPSDEPHHPESDSESIAGPEDPIDQYRSEWMQEAQRRPGDRTIVRETDALGNREIDVYDWVDNSGSLREVKDANQWMAGMIFNLYKIYLY